MIYKLFLQEEEEEEEVSAYSGLDEKLAHATKQTGLKYFLKSRTPCFQIVALLSLERFSNERQKSFSSHLWPGKN